ncbi:hypothetical protein R3W88_000831 [Solanum pinnatisectum]|uniref:Uncharacterized protein n=1 Tax=Solanum pinnatisectum TaxID=50273 RepID=A0AAV9MJE6_9SOLN|nr:hypothetical protein R3W88_000831 [Solanum pinnatisectum]
MIIERATLHNQLEASEEQEALLMNSLDDHQAWLNNCHENMGRVGRQVHQLGKQTSYVIKNHRHMNDTEVIEQARSIVSHLPKIFRPWGGGRRRQWRWPASGNVLLVTNPKAVPWNYNRIAVFYRGKEIVEEDTIGEIKLNMTIGLVDFMIVFQVMDMATSYNFFLGRPWTWLGKSHQLCIRLLSLNTTSRKSLCMGKMIYLFIEIHTFHTLRQKRDLLLLFTSLLRLYQSIDSKKETSSSNDVSLLPLQWVQKWKLLLLMKTLKKLFRISVIGEGTSHAHVQLVGLGVELNNREATPFPIRKESW